MRAVRTTPTREIEHPTPVQGVASGRNRRFMWIGLALAMFALPFLSLPGRYIADTFDVLWFDPGYYLRHSLSLWQASPFLQGQPNLWIMAIIIWLFRGLRFAPWAAQRLWYGLLLFVGAAGMIKLTEELRGRRGLLAPLVAGVVYVAGPFTLGYGLVISALFPSYALLPWLLLVTARYLHREGLWGPCLFAVVVFLMGGGNGAPQVYAMVPVVAYALWVVGVERSVPLGRALRFAGWSVLLAVGLNAYWLIALSPKGISNALHFSEQPQVINVSSSYSESIRSLGFWQYYGGDQFGPWLPTVRRFITSPLFIVTGFAIPVGAVLSAWLVRWRFRLLFLFLAILAIVGMAGIFPVSSPTPFGRFLLFAYAHIPGADGLRTTYKLGGILDLSLALLVAVGLEEAWRWPGTVRDPVVWRSALAAGVVVVLGAYSFPLWAGGYRGERSTPDIPGYWRSALGYLDAREAPNRAFFAPGALLISYRWGGLVDGVTETRPSLPSLVPWPFPVDGHYQTDLLAAIEQPYQDGLPVKGSATLFRYVGVKDVVLQNDIDWQRASTARPAQMRALADDPSLVPLTTFGAIGQNTTAPSAPGAPRPAATAEERGLTPVQVLTVPQALPPVRADAGAPVILSGDGFGLASASRAGLLDGNPPVLYSGTLSAADLAALAGRHPAIVISDSNRRRVYSINSRLDDHSYTLPRGQSLGAQPIGYELFDNRQDAQSTAVYQGVRSIVASGYGSVLAAQPEFQPPNAFDGNPATWWLVGALGNPLGAWVQVDLEHPTPVSEVKLSMPDIGFGRRVSAVRLIFSNGSSVLASLNEDQTTISLAPRMTESLRVQIAGVTGPGNNAVGFADVAIAGVTMRPAIQVPHDLLDRARRSPAVAALIDRASLSYVFERARRPRGLAPEEATLDRLFTVPSARAFALHGSGELNPNAPDDQIDALVRGSNAIHASSSSRLFNDPKLRASAALDGDPRTAWVPNGTVGQWLRVSFPARRIDRLTLQAQTVQGRSPVTRVRVRFSDGSFMQRSVDPQTGTLPLRFPPRRTSSVTVTITGAFNPGPQPPPIGISELAIPGISLPVVPPRHPLPCTSAAVDLDGSGISVRPSGTVGQLLAGTALNMSTCDGKPIRMSLGQHELVAAGGLLPDSVMLTSPAQSEGSTTTEPATTPPTTAPGTVVHQTSGSGYDVDVRRATGPFYLVLGQDYAPGWVASIDGKSLGSPQVLDGYSVGWPVNRMGSFRVSVRYNPQRRYDAALLVSAAFLILVLALLLRLAVKRLPLPAAWTRRLSSGKERS